MLFVSFKSFMSLRTARMVFIHVCLLLKRVPILPLVDPRLRLRPFFFWAAIFFLRKVLRPFFGFAAITPSRMSRLTYSEVIASSMSAILVGSIHTRLFPHFIIFAAISSCDLIFLTFYFLSFPLTVLFL